MKIVNVVGARPNFMKIALLVAEMGKFPQIHAPPSTLDSTMISKCSGPFQDLEMPKPDRPGRWLGQSRGPDSQRDDGVRQSP